MAVVIYGGARATVEKQLSCSHEWHGPCMDQVSRYNKCVKCFVIERDLQSEQAYFQAEKKAAMADAAAEPTDEGR